jgi:hypothetical protein
MNSVNKDLTHLHISTDTIELIYMKNMWGLNQDARIRITHHIEIIDEDELNSYGITLKTSIKICENLMMNI